MKKSVLFHTVNGIGLGHLSRQISIAQWIKTLSNNEIYILFMTSSEKHNWLFDNKIPFYYLPSEPHYRYTWSIADSQIDDGVNKNSSPIGMNKEIMKAIISNNSWSAIIFDTYFDEELLILAHNLGIKIYGFFDSENCLSFHNNLIQLMAKKGVTLLLGSDMKPYSNLSSMLRVEHVGRVFKNNKVRRSSTQNVENEKINKLRVVCVQGGGGFDSQNSEYYKKNPHFADVVFEALTQLFNTGQDLECIFITGPYDNYFTNKVKVMPEWLQIIEFEENLIELLATADFAISKCGYNAISDSINSLCPTIFLPQIEETENQNYHLEKLINSKAAFKTNHDSTDLFNSIKEILSDDSLLFSVKQNLKNLSQFNGAELTAKIVVADIFNKKVI